MKVRIKKTPPPIGVQVEKDQYKTLSKDGVMLEGNSHEKDGTKVQVGPRLIEAEAGEPLYRNTVGDTDIFGNLTNPITGKLFKNDAKGLLKEKGKEEKAIDKASKNIEELDPFNKFEALAYNSNIVALDGAQIKETKLKSELDSLAKIQNSILNTSEATGQDPNKIGKAMFKNGGKVKVKFTGLPQAQNGITVGLQEVPQFSLPVPQFNLNTALVTPPAQTEFAPKPTSLAARNNNPGNLRFNGQKGATKGDRGFAKFNSYEDGMAALENDIRAKQTGKSRTGLKPTSTLQDFVNVYAPKADSNDPTAYANFLAKNLGVTIDTPISQLNTSALAQNIAKFEDSAYANYQGNVGNTPPQATPSPTQAVATPIEGVVRDRPVFAPLTTQTVPTPITTSTTPPPATPITRERFEQGIQSINSQQSAPAPKTNKLSPLDFLGEMSAILDQPDYVQGQQFDPYLATPYKVSFQDQINQNTASFNAQVRAMGNNPEALATLAGQKYAQDQSILANEFRANQQVQSQIANQNLGTLNQAELTNIQLADQQYQRQAQAQAITDQNRSNALNSISNKYAQNELYNNSRQEMQKRGNVLSQMYEQYRFDENGNVVFQNNNPGVFDMFGIQMTPEAQQAQNNRTAAQNVAQAAFGVKIKRSK